MCLLEEYRTSRHSFRYQENREGKGLSRPFARLIDDLFALDQRVRYVAVLDRNHRLVESRMRTHVASFTPEEYDRKFMGSVPPLVSTRSRSWKDSADPSATYPSSTRRST